MPDASDDAASRGEVEDPIEVLKEKLLLSTGNRALRQQLADAFVTAGRVTEATEILGSLAEEHARAGAPGKAIALLKRMQEIDPSNQHRGEALIAQLSRERDQEDAQAEWQRRTEKKRGRAASGSLLSPELEAIPLDVDLGRTSAPGSASSDGAPSLTFDLDETAGIHKGDVGASPLFSDLSADELLAVIRGLRLVSAEPGDIIVTEGASGNSLFFLTTGTVKVFVRDADGDNHPIRKMTDGSFFGEVSILSGKPRSATIAAATPCELLELDRPTLDGIARVHPHVMEVLETFSSMRAGSAAEAQARKGKKGD